MKNNKEILKKWFKLAEPNKKLFIIQTIFGILARATFVIIPIPAAKLIVSLTKEDYKSAGVFALIVCSLAILRQLFWHVYYMAGWRSNAHTYLKIQDKIFDKFLNIKEGELKKKAKEKIFNIINVDIYDVAMIARHLSRHIAPVIRIITTIVILFFINNTISIF